MDTAESRIENNMQIQSESEKAGQNIVLSIKMSKSEPLAAGNEWSEEVVGNEYEWSEPEVYKHK